MRFLVIRLSSIGDIVHALPAVAALGAAFPEAEITWAVETGCAALLEGNPVAGRVIKLDTIGWRKGWASAVARRDFTRSVRELREFRYDAAIDFQGLLKSAIIAWLSRSERRVGRDDRWLREPVAGAFYTERAGGWGRRHAIEENLALVERVGVPNTPQAQWRFPLPYSAEAEGDVTQRLGSLGAAEFLIINPGGGWARKRWPPENYAKLIRALEPEIAWRFLLTGSPAEEPLISEVLAGAGAQRATYFPSTLVQFVALVRRAKLFVGGDTGPLHLAAAVGTPIVGIYGPTDPARNGPFSPSDIALSNGVAGGDSPRFRVEGSVDAIGVDTVLAAIRRRLRAAHG